MKITYTQNPLATVVELDDHDRRILRLKLEIEDLTERVFGAHYALSYQKPPDIERAAREANCDWMDGEKAKERDAQLDEQVAYYEAELRSHHVGDCTCVACSCDKCHAESLFGIDTIQGISKHGGHKIACAFGKDGDHSIDEALTYLRDYDPKPSGDGSAWAKLGGFEQYVPGWKADAAKAYEWLIQYRAEHFADAVVP